MEEYLLSHILDLARQSKQKEKTFFSDFLGVSEQGSLANILQGETIEGTPFLSFGGHQEAVQRGYLSAVRGFVPARDLGDHRRSQLV